MPPPAGKDDTFRRFAGKGVYPVEYAHVLLTPLRKLICPPSTIVKRLRLKPSDRVLEIGAGPGYFSPSVARALPSGWLAMFDLQPGMLAIATGQMRAAGLHNYACVVGDACSLPFADASFDAVFMVTVLGEVPDTGLAMREVARVLAPGGRASLTEMAGDPDFLSRKTLRALAVSAGLDFEQSFGPPFLHTGNFLKPWRSSSGS